MIVYFANRKMEILGQASTTLPNGNKIIEDLKSEEIETGIATFSCKIIFREENRLLVEEMTEAGNYLLRSSDDENEFYTIIDVEIDTKAHEIYIYAEDAGLDLLNEIAPEYEATEAHTSEWYINKYTNDSGFSIGINEISDNSERKLSWDSESTVTERLASIATKFGGFEVSYSFDIQGMEITNKYINIYKERGKDVNEQLRLNKDIDRIITKKSVANLATAFYCKGATPQKAKKPITLSGYKYDDGDFYVDGCYLKSRNAVAKWSRYLWEKKNPGYQGHIIRQYSYDTTSQATLCSHAVTELKKICDMEVNYEVDINKLPENIKIGDRINIIDDAGELYLSARILLLETSIVDQTQKATLGEYLIKESGISQTVTELASKFSEVENLSKNISDTYATKEDVESVEAVANQAQSNIEQLSTDIENTYATKTDFGELQAKDLEHDNTLDTKANITELEENYATKQNLNETNETVETLKVAKADITALNATNAEIENLKAKDIEVGGILANKADISDLNAVNAQISNLNTKYVTIDLANINKASVGTLFADVGLITSASIVDGHITGYLDSVEVNANNITAGTLTVDRLVINGSNKSLVYALNNMGDLVSSEVNTIDGDVITKRTINADHIVAGSITSNEINVDSLKSAIITAGSITANEIDVVSIQSALAKIGPFNIFSGGLYTNGYWDNELNSVSSNIDGVYIGKDKISFGKREATCLKKDGSFYLGRTSVDGHIHTISYEVNEDGTDSLSIYSINDINMSDTNISSLNVSQNLDVSGVTTVNTLSVSQNAMIGKTLNVTDKATVGGLEVKGGVDIKDSAMIHNQLFVTNKASLGELKVSGNTTLDTLTVTNPTLATEETSGYMTSDDKKKVNKLSSDTGWVTCKLASGFETYADDQVLKVRRIGDLVEIRGAVKTTKNIAGSANMNAVITTLDDVFIPSQRIVTSAVGTGVNTQLFSIYPNGNVTLLRYINMKDGSYTTVTNSMWIQLQASWIGKSSYIENKYFKCDECEESFNSQLQLNNHYQQVHI